MGSCHIGLQSRAKKLGTPLVAIHITTTITTVATTNNTTITISNNTTISITTVTIPSRAKKLGARLVASLRPILLLLTLVIVIRII